MARKKFNAEEIIKHLRTVEIERSKGLTQEQAHRDQPVARLIGHHQILM
jgi:hypothetical protein